MGKFLTREEFLSKAQLIYGDTYNYAFTNYVRSNTNIIVFCYKHGTFEVTPNNHLNHNGCPKCSGRHKTTEDFINEAKLVHGDKYDYTKTRYHKSSDILTITCPIHGNFTQLASSHLQGYGCKDCGIARTIEQTKNDLKELIIKANTIHDNKYNYSKFIYKSMKVDGIIICPIHGEFPQCFDHHLQGEGCPFCVGKNKTTESFIKEAKEIHGNKYDYSLVNYVKSNVPVKIICPIHGEFEQIPNSHLLGCGCKDCADEELSTIRKKSLEQRIKEFNIIHSNKYDYSLIKDIKNARDFIEIICSIHGSFTQQVTSHQQGYGCPYCKNSYMEKFTRNLLLSKNINFTQEKRINCYSKKGLRLDFYIELKNNKYAIECQGFQHYSPVEFFGGEKAFKEQVVKDKVKKQYCTSNNIKLLETPYWLTDEELTNSITNFLNI
jgi:hypothetical protein